MNISERSTGYKGYLLVAQEPLEAYLGVGDGPEMQDGWFVPDVDVKSNAHAETPEKERTLRASEWFEKGLSSPAKTKKEAIEKAFKFAKKAIDNGFVLKK